MTIRRPGGEEDVAGLIRVHGLGWREAYDETLPDSILEAQTVDPTAEEVRRWSEGIGGDRTEVFVAVDDETGADDVAIRGFVDVRWGDESTKSFVGEGEAGLRAIYVDPDRWGEGIGTALLERALDALADNEIGRRFYGRSRPSVSGLDPVAVHTRRF